MPFDYILSLKSSWPPTRRPEPPYGPSAIEVMRSCPLRSCFEASAGYERRVGTAARIGTAMHKALQSLVEEPVWDESLEKVSEEATRRFYWELDAQKMQATEHHREATLQWDATRIHRALEVVIAEAIRNQGMPRMTWRGTARRNQAGKQDGLTGQAQNPVQLPQELPACEVTVGSNDGLFRGRIDRVEANEAGVRLVDYKSAYRDDLPGMYARQIQLYAFMWYEMSGEWPAEGQVFYPMKGTFYPVPVDEDICQATETEARGLIRLLGEKKAAYELSNPGDTCKVCEFRPWCRAFWSWQSAENVLIKAKEKAGMGFEGRLESCSLAEHYWRMHVIWKGIQLRIIVPQERFPHLEKAMVGQTVRVLDAPLTGALSQPTVQIYDTTEIFLIV